ncbi:hypothetical protein VNI00_009672 [Paramarasmius palmivorus]|uniref:Uncharacterized protein n=1 Tax=Paramarasmius palmivorus TaxID=297713 RepID=A0AAW0CS39_9AGAR
MSVRHNHQKHMPMQPLKPLYLVERYFGHTDSTTKADDLTSTNKENKPTPKIPHRVRISDSKRSGSKPVLAQSTKQQRAIATSSPKALPRRVPSKPHVPSTANSNVKSSTRRLSSSASSPKSDSNSSKCRDPDSFSSNQAMPSIELKSIRSLRNTQLRRSVPVARRERVRTVTAATAEVTNGNKLEPRIHAEEPDGEKQDPEVSSVTQQVPSAENPSPATEPENTPCPSSSYFETINTRFGPCRVRRTAAPVTEGVNSRIQLELKALRSQKLVQCGGRRETPGEKQLSLLSLGILGKHSKL